MGNFANFLVSTISRVRELSEVVKVVDENVNKDFPALFKID